MAKSTTEPFGKPDICKHCKCHKSMNENDAQLVHDWAGRNFQHSLRDWPDNVLMYPDKISSHNTDYHKRIIVIYFNNSVTILQQLPPTQNQLQFSCRHSDLNDISSDASLNTSNIARLDLSHNNLTDVLQPTNFRDAKNYELINLVELDLSHNQIRSLDSRLFQHARMIKKLSLQHNPFNALDDGTIEAISSLKHLEDLNLASTGLSELSRNLLQPLHNLKLLIIHGNNFTDVPETLAHSRNTLKSLNIDDNPIVYFNFNSFLGLSELTHLNMSELKNLTDIRPESFSSLKSIEVINSFGNARLTRFDFNSLATMPQLRELDVSSCGLSNLEISFTNASAGNNHSNILLFPNLKKLKLENNPWLCNCDLLQQLRRMNYCNILQNHDKKTEARCSEPYEVAGMLLMNCLNITDCKGNERNSPIYILHDLWQCVTATAINIVGAIVALIITAVSGFFVGYCFVIKRELKPDLSRQGDVNMRLINYNSRARVARVSLK